MVPGVLPDPECFEEESHWNGLLEYPQYSRPAVWHDRAVPEVLLSGDHGKVADWRKKESYKRTMRRRPDLFAKFDESQLITKAEKKVLQQAKDELAAEDKHRKARCSVPHRVLSQFLEHFSASMASTSISTHSASMGLATSIT